MDAPVDDSRSLRSEPSVESLPQRSRSPSRFLEHLSDPQPTLDQLLVRAARAGPTLTVQATDSISSREMPAPLALAPSPAWPSYPASSPKPRSPGLFGRLLGRPAPSPDDALRRVVSNPHHDEADKSPTRPPGPLRSLSSPLLQLPRRISVRRDRRGSAQSSVADAAAEEEAVGRGSFEVLRGGVYVPANGAPAEGLSPSPSPLRRKHLSLIAEGDRDGGMQCVGRSRRPSRTPLDLAIFEGPEGEPRQRRHSIDQGTLRFPPRPAPVAHSEPCSPTTSRIVASGGVRQRPGFLAIPPLQPVFLPLGASTTPPPVRARLLWGDSMRVSPDSKEMKDFEEFVAVVDFADRTDSSHRPIGATRSANRRARRA